MVKRLFDLIASTLGLLLLWPVFVVVAVLIKLESSGPVFFRQERIGQFGKPFRIHKFRTMASDAESRGPKITVGQDRRVTRVGSFLRRYKIDELAQLIDVVVGRMSLVGPRPEVPQYVDCYPPEIKDIVLSVKPGITDWASIEYKDESTILGAASDPQNAYVNEVLPVKLRYYVEYVQNSSFIGDLLIIFSTLRVIIAR
ncbi:sugar transferase [Limnohabitans sp.]|uniref:sugar transferase n=1 Tax=Limnohabitans sp. TaxID=1907725 RepID=UPI00286F429C|nr:sugar transferase [Limnohabitans sp.]